ncbi:MAG: DapH/DapD/GlmU-related protein [Bacteroidota bacterium]
MNIHPSALISLKARLDKTNPKGIYIGKKSVITTGVVILTHNYVMGNGTFVNTKIGNSVFIGANSIILPGITIGNNIIIGAGSIVTKDVEDYSIIAGNPARLIRKDESIGDYGQFIKSKE